MICKKCKKQIEEDSIFCRFCGKKQVAETIERKKQKRPTGLGTVYKVSGNRRKPYVARVSRMGKLITIGSYATQTEAYIALESANLNGIPNLYNATLEDIYNTLLGQKQDHVSDSCMTGYAASFGYLKPLANTKMREIRTAHFQHVIDEAIKQGKSYSTIKKVQTLGAMICKIAMANDLIDKNYAQLVNVPISAPRSDKPSFTDEQLKVLWDLSDTNRTAAAIVALCYSGLRINEFLDLKKEHVDLDKRLIYAPGSKTEAGKDRIIIIPHDLVSIYKRMMDSPGGYLYPSPKGKRHESKNFSHREFAPLLDSLNMNADGKLTPHSCRHTYALLCVKYDLNQKATMDLIGHAKFSTTAEIYANATSKDVAFLQREADKLKRV